jgi:hypothetical protein
MIQTCSCGTVRVGCLAVSVLFGAASVEETSSLPTLAPMTSISLDDRLKEVGIDPVSPWVSTATSRSAELVHCVDLGETIARCARGYA